LFKNVTLVEGLLNGKRSWRLLGPDGRPMLAFDSFSRSLERNSVNTRINYCRWLAEFLDFLHEASNAIAEDDNAYLDQETLLQVIEAYHEYLVFGSDSGNAIARVVNARMPSPRHPKRTSAIKHAAIRRFLRLSERTRAQMVELTRHGFKEFSFAEHNLFPALQSQRALTLHERRALVANSMLAGVIAGGPRLLEDAFLPTTAPFDSGDQDRAMPFDKIEEVLRHLTSWRDKALYALCAASGCRISEALQVLWQDIEVGRQKVKLVDPGLRPNDRSYLALNPVDRDRLVWKGRTTSLTLLIEPFATMFFEALAGYIKHELVPHGRHQFVFQYERHGDIGRPYFLAAASSRNGVLSRAIRLAGIENIEGPHSFRHMYGTYLLNYFPRLNGTYGLPLPLVQKLMGHSSAKSTSQYARYDQDLIAAELRHANMILVGPGNHTSLAALKREALLQRLKMLEADMALEEK